MIEFDYFEIGQKMQKLRKEKGFTQEFIANKLDVTVSYISNIENNKVKINLRVLSYYASILGVSIDYLIRTGGNSLPENNVLDVEILKLLEQFSDEEKEKVIKILRVINE